MKEFVRASAYAGLVVAIGMGFLYTTGQAPSLGPFVAVLAFVPAFLCAVLLAFLIFAKARVKLNELHYFLLHLGVGVLIGSILAARNPHVTGLWGLVYNHQAALAWTASLAAWLYVVLYVPAGRMHAEVARPKLGEYSPIVLIIGLIVLPIPIIIAPTPTDPSCHNVLRGGRLSASVSGSMRMIVPAEDVSTLVGIYEQFAKDYDLQIRGHALRPESAQRNICDENVTIVAGGVFSNGQHSILFYQSEAGPGWGEMAGDLVCRLEYHWKDSITFTGKAGEPIEKPAILKIDCADPARRAPIQ